MFARILVPLDGSPLAEAILPEVVELAKLHAAEVLLLRVALARTFPGADPTDAQVRVLEEAEKYLTDVNERLAAQGIKVSTAVRYGQAAEQILDHAQTNHADLIAMSTHGRSGLAYTLLGSVAAQIVRTSPVPVLLLRARTLDVRPFPAEVFVPAIHHILCPVDFSSHSEAAMRYAHGLVQQFHADLTVLHVVDEPLDITGFHIPHPPLEQIREELIREAERRLKNWVHHRLRVRTHIKMDVVLGHPFREISRYAREHPVDVIVMGTQGLTGLERLVMGSTTERVVRTAPCPVVSIRSAA